MKFREVFKKDFGILLVAAMLVCVPTAEAASVMQMDLGSLCDRSDKIFRGRVIDSKTGTIQVGGGELPIVTYLIEVEETFKGEFGPKPVVEIRQVESKSALVPVSGDTKRVSLFAGLPTLSVGEEYLLFTTQPSPVGLSTTA